MRKAFRVSVMAMALCVPAFAGDIPCPPVATPPPPSPAASGEIHTGATESTTEVDELTRITLGLLQSVLTLF